LAGVVADLPALRQAARTILAAAIQAGDARRLTAEALRLSGDRLGVGELAIDLDDVQRVLVVGAGKASGAMAEAVEAALGERVAEGLVVVKESRGVRTSRVRVVAGGHPLPDERGHRAAQEILRLATEAGPRDVLLCLISGGGSALAPLPVEGLGLGDKQAVSRVLLESGATIGELNAVRKHQ
jgi:hydroxypyruvate reductase